MALGTDPSRGLTESDARRILEECGPNLLSALHRPPWWRELLRKFAGFFALLLWGAALLAVLAGLPQLALAIALVVVINGVFAFIQEQRAEHAGERLRAMLPLQATVLRDGEVRRIEAADVVPGDIAVLAEGDRITADMCCLASQALLVDTSTMTGESVPRAAAPGDALAAGTFIVGGRGSAEVSATGRNTRFAHLAELTAARPRPRTPLERDIHRLVRVIAAIALSVGAAFFALMLLLGVPVSDGLIFGIGVAVALVPESLLPTVTLSLAIGAQRMAAQNALIRRLESVETLGSTTVICTDKTGTLTQNRMNVVAVWTADGPVRVAGSGYDPAATVAADGPRPLAAAARAAAAARTCSSGYAAPDGDQWRAHGDPLEAAIDTLARRLGVDQVPAEAALRPFDPLSRVAIALQAGIVACKGAPEAVAATCQSLPEGFDAALAHFTEQGLRVIAVASGPGPDASEPPAVEALADLQFLGLLALEDPPRPGVTEAVGQCREAGIRLAMITGDHPRTARAIGAEIGLWLPGAPVLTGSELPADDAELGRLVDRDGVVLARITPEDKLRIAACLRARGNVVAMTGDGVNDAPAMREADIGVAMGATGTDVARESADLVLLDDHFATIVNAVRMGRASFINTRRFLTYHLTDNVAELAPFLVWAVSGGAFPLALGILQILALDIGTDTLPAIALGAEPPSNRVLRRRPLTGGLMTRTVATRAFGVLGPTEALAEMAVFVAALALAGWRPGLPFPGGAPLAAASGAAFLTVVVMQCANAYACRSSTEPPWRSTSGRNRFLVPAVIWAVAFAVACLMVPPIASAMHQQWPPWAVLPAILAGAPLLLAVDAAWKHRRRARTGPATAR